MIMDYFPLLTLDHHKVLNSDFLTIFANKLLILYCFEFIKH